MDRFSASDAALEGFRLTREQPVAVLVWAGFYLVFSLILAALLIGFGGENLAALEAATSADSDPDPAATLASLQALAPLYLVLVPLGIIVPAIVAGAVYRALLRPGEPGVGFLRLGADEVRLALLTLIYLFLWVGAVVVVAVLAGMLATLGAAAAGPAGGLVAAAVTIFSLGLLVYVAVRLSLAGAATFHQRRLVVFGSWKLTRGHFWPLFGAYLLAVVLALIVMLMAMLIFTLLATAAMGGDIASAGAIFSPDVSSLAAYFSPVMIAYTVFSSLLNAIYYAVMVAPTAVAYRSLAAVPEAAEVF